MDVAAFHIKQTVWSLWEARFALPGVLARLFELAVSMFTFTRGLAILAAVAIGLVSSSPAALPARDACVPGTWQRLADLPIARQEGNLAAIDDRTIALIGGIHNIEGPWQSTNIVHLYDVATNTWRRGSDSPFRFNHPNVAAVNGKIYVLGGLQDASLGNDLTYHSKATGECFVYDVAKDSWSALGTMPRGQERGSATMAVQGDVIYLAGGMTNLQDHSQDSVSVVTAYNTATNRWVNLPLAATSLPEGRQHSGGAVHDNSLYLVGGRRTESQPKDTVFKLDLRRVNSGWSLATRLPVPRGGLSSGVANGKIYAIGGEGDPSNADGVFNITQAFDVSTRRWTQLSPMDMPRHGTHGVTIGNRIYMPGGGLQEGAYPTDYFDALCAF